MYKKFNEILENQSTSNDLDILSKYLENTYIANSAKKIMDLVTKKYEEQSYQEEQKLKLNVSNLIIDMLYEIRYFLMKRDFLIKILPKKIVKKVTKGKKLGRISRTDIIKKLNLFNKIQETDFDYKVKKIAPDTFIISTKD